MVFADEEPTPTYAAMDSSGCYENSTSSRFFLIAWSGGNDIRGVKISEELESKGLNIRVVSMPCKEIYEQNKEEYKKELFPIGIKVIVLEAGSKTGWESYVYNQKYLITINDFGYSGTKEEIEKKVNFDYESLKEKIIKLIR